MMSSTPRSMPPPKSLALKRGVIALAMIDGRQRVGQRAFEPVADFDADAMFVGRDEQQDAVVLGLLAELPGPEELVGIGLDLFALQRRDRCDDELDAGFLLEIGELGLDRGGRRGRDDMRLSTIASAERREIRRAPRPARAPAAAEA